uniref:Uncharacterized protein n=1 Tax=Moschus moschiferus TaxID=68415 RepID=A0A8C6DAA6_MOSMO
MVISAFKVVFSFLIKEITFLVTCLELPKGSLRKSLIISSHLPKIAAANSTKQRWKNDLSNFTEEFRKHRHTWLAKK